MAKIDLKFKEKSDAELIGFARNVIIQLNGSPFFVEKKPQLSELIQAINELETEHTRNNNDNNSRLLLKLFRNSIELKLTRLAIFIQEVTAGEPDLIAQCGMEIRKTNKKQIIYKSKTKKL